MARLISEANAQIQILVAEDDNFQRLALIDVLELCNYNGTTRMIIASKFPSRCCRKR